MASTFSDILRLELQADGENENTWGQKLNEALDKIETAIAGLKAISLSASDVTLTTNDGGDGDDEQAAAMILDLSGTVTADVDVIVPNKSKVYLVYNGCTVSSGSVNIRTADGDPLEIEEGSSRVVWCDADDNLREISTPVSDGDSGSFTGTLTGFSTTVQGTFYWYRLGERVTIFLGPTALQASTSNSSAMTLTGAPAEIWPSSNKYDMCRLLDGGSSGFGASLIKTDGVIQFENSGISGSNRVIFSTALFTSGALSKGLPGSWSISYVRTGTS